MNRSTILKIITLFGLWRFALFALAIFADNFLPYLPSFPYATTLLPQFDVPRWIYSFANFDGVHYLTIAREGYGSVDFIQAFFPLLPYILLHVPNLLGFEFNPLIVGLLITNTAFFAFLCAWFVFVKEEYDERVAWFSTFVYLLFPTTFFFGALYTESLFLLFTVLSLLFSRRRKWFFASVCVAIACSTRIVGIFLIPMLLWELYLHYMNTEKKRDLGNFIQTQFTQIVTVLFGSSGLLLYMYFLWRQFGDPFYFFHVQSSFGAGRQSDIILYPQVVYRYIKIFFTVPIFALKGYTYIQEAVVAIIGLLFLFISYTRVKMSYLLFAIPAFILPTLTGNFSSMPRYVLVCFPLFLWTGIVLSEHKRVGYIWFFISMGLLLWNALLFIQGYWVA